MMTIVCFYVSSHHLHIYRVSSSHHPESHIMSCPHHLTILLIIIYLYILARFENDRTISFIPPDGEFELMSYRLNTQVVDTDMDDDDVLMDELMDLWMDG